MLGVRPYNPSDSPLPYVDTWLSLVRLEDIHNTDLLSCVCCRKTLQTPWLFGIMLCRMHRAYLSKKKYHAGSALKSSHLYAGVLQHCKRLNMSAPFACITSMIYEYLTHPHERYGLWVGCLCRREIPSLSSHLLKLTCMVRVKSFSKSAASFAYTFDHSSSMLLSLKACV